MFWYNIYVMDFVFEAINVPFWESLLDKLPRAIVVAVFGFILLQIVLFGAKKIFKLLKLPKDFSGIAASIINAILWIILLTAIFTQLGLQHLAIYVTGYTAILVFFLSAGAAQLVADLISGFFLAGDKNFKTGDMVICGEDKTEGIIESMDARKTRIRDKSGKLHVIPNSLVEKKEWVVLATAREMQKSKIKNQN